MFIFFYHVGTINYIKKKCRIGPYIKLKFKNLLSNLQSFRMPWNFKTYKIKNVTLE